MYAESTFSKNRHAYLFKIMILDREFIRKKNIPKSLPTPGNRILTSTDYRILFHISKLCLKKERKSIPKKGNCIGLFKKSMWTKKVA